MDVSRLDMGFFRDIAEKLRTQDNACTADPIPTVQEEVRDYGVDEEYGGEFEWVHDDGDYDPVSEAKANIRTQSHRHRGQLRTYIESAYRNPEMRKLREQILALAGRETKATNEQAVIRAAMAIADSEATGDRLDALLAHLRSTVIEMRRGG